MMEGKTAPMRAQKAAGQRPKKEYLVQAQDEYSEGVVFEALRYKNEDKEWWPQIAGLKHVWVLTSRTIVRKILQTAKKKKPEAKIKVFSCIQGTRDNPRECTHDFTHPPYKFPEKVLRVKRNAGATGAMISAF